jgi:methylthioribose-1-phosphate isomerase
LITTKYCTIRETADAKGVEVLDQRLLPHSVRTVTLSTFNDVNSAIRDMIVRGAPLIGALAAYGLYFAARDARADTVRAELEQAARVLAEARPTAINLGWAIEYVLDAAKAAADGDVGAAVLDAARRIVADELERSRRIGEAGMPLIQRIAEKKAAPSASPSPSPNDAVHVLTHCNAGRLATIDLGTATAPVYAAHAAGIPVHVWVDETRPRNQGAALTAFELGERGVAHDVVVDNAGGHLMQQGMVDIVIVGADRVAANGDAANKIGTYLKALAAHDNGIPFYVAVPTSSIDWSMADGSQIPIEERDADEVRYMEGMTENGIARVLLVPAQTGARNFGFDITPARLITGFITEHGVVAPDQLDQLRKQS